MKTTKPDGQTLADPRAAGEAAHTLPVQLYHHKTDGGAEYLSDKFILCPNGDKEGIFENAGFVIRIDGDITKDAEIIGGRFFDSHAALVAALNIALCKWEHPNSVNAEEWEAWGKQARAALAQAKGGEVNEPSRCAIDHALTNALIRREHLKRDPLAMTEAIANYHATIAATAIHLREIILQIQLYPDMRTAETDKVIVHLRGQITSHYFNTFGVMPSWEKPQ